MDPREHLAGLVLAALLSTLLGVPTQTTTELQEAAVLQASIESFAERVQ